MITMHTTFDLLARDRSRESTPVHVILSWDPTEAVAVSVTFGHHGGLREPVTWVIARDTLAAGLLGPSGVGGDVIVYPVLHRLRIVLNPPSGHAEFDLDPTVLDRFLLETYRQCPAGAEFDDLDVEAELLALIESEAA